MTIAIESTTAGTGGLSFRRAGVLRRWLGQCTLRQWLFAVAMIAL